MNDMMWFWFWWALTIGLVAWQIVRALFDAKFALGFPVVAGLMWLYIYGILPYGMARCEAVPAAVMPIAQFLPFAAYGSLLIGWHLRLNRGFTRRVSGKRASFDLQRLSDIGVALTLAGLAGFVSFRYAGEPREEASAYWYLFFHLVFPGISLCVAATAISPSSPRQRNLVLAALLIAPLIVRQLISARRGPTFTAVIAISCSYLLVRPRLPRPAILLSIIGGCGVLMVFLVAARAVVYHDGTWNEAISTMSIFNVFEERMSRTSDNEFYNHCLLLEADLRTGYYQYGTGHLAVLLNFIPRSVWPDKPRLSVGDGFYPSAMNELQAGSPHNLGHGGAWGPVVDSFNNYWWFFPLFWLLIGYLVAAVYVRAFEGDSLRWKMHYVGVLCATHWFITQCLGWAFVPAMIYQATYFLAFWYAKVPGNVEPRAPGGEQKLNRENGQ